MNPCRTVSPCRYSSSRVLTSAFPGDCESNTAAMASPYRACMRRPRPVGGASSSRRSGIPSSDAAVRLFRFGEQGAGRRGLERFGEQVALPEPTPERDEARALRDRLDALRHHAQTEVARQVHDRAHDLQVGAARPMRCTKERSTLIPWTGKRGTELRDVSA